MKKCSSCNLEKSFFEFYKSKLTKDGLDCYCKGCNGKYSRENTRKRRLLYPEDFKYRKMSDRAKDKGYQLDFYLEQFRWWYNLEPKKCTYCDNEDPGRFGEFTIDRKDSNLQYSLQNICLSCWDCNRLKNDFFSDVEFREIAQKYIKPKWLSAYKIPLTAK